jgi:hypothetical protein
MRKVILAAALAATFCLPQTSHAQQGGGGAGAGAPAGGAVGGAGGAAGTRAGGAEAGGDIATSSPRADEPTSVGAASEDAQVELARLRAEVDRLRAELDEAKGVRRGGREEGTGGSGTEQESEPQPIASAVLEGRVSKVSKKSIEVIDHETGEPYVLRLNEDSRARSGQRRIPVTRIRQGSEVRASFDLISGDTFATQIDVLGKGRR